MQSWQWVWFSRAGPSFEPHVPQTLGQDNVRRDFLCIVSSKMLHVKRMVTSKGAAATES